MGSTRRPGGRGGDIDRRRALDLVVTGERRIHRVMRCVRKRDNGMGLLTAQVARIPHAAVLVVRRDEGCLFAVVIAEAVDDEYNTRELLAVGNGQEQRRRLSVQECLEDANVQVVLQLLLFKAQELLERLSGRRIGSTGCRRALHQILEQGGIEDGHRVEVITKRLQSRVVGVDGQRLPLRVAGRRELV